MIPRRQPERFQVLAFALAHGAAFLLRSIVVAGQVQRAVHDAQQQLFVERPAEPLRPRGRRIGADDDLSAQGPAFIAQVEAEHIGGPIVIEIPPVQLVDGGIVDDRQTDLRRTRTLGLEHLTHHDGQSRCVHRARLPVGRLHLDGPFAGVGSFHAVCCRSGYLTRP